MHRIKQQSIQVSIDVSIRLKADTTRLLLLPRLSDSVVSGFSRIAHDHGTSLNP
jgi:hypothetical protein